MTFKTYTYLKNFLGIFFLTLIFNSYVQAENIIINSEKTEFQGIIAKEKNNNKVYSFLGIPFAEPPINDLRWRAPRDLIQVPTEINATELPNRCMQVSNFYDSIDGIESGSIMGSEDCLYLNIYVSESALKSNKELPVMFWIHGGGNTWGYSASNLFTSGDFVLDHDIVLVTTNYRLGPFGWFSYNGLNEDSNNELDKSANFGTLDLMKSLEWVRDNIQYFNGNPDNITIFGESAGARNVISLMSSPLSKDLFKRGISQSGYLGSDSLEFAQNDPRSGSKGLITKKLIETNPDIATIEIEEILNNSNKSESFLRSLSATEIVKYYRVQEDSGGLIDVPNVIPDGIVIPEKGIYGVYRDGEMHDKNMIFGSTRDEDKLFMIMNDEFVDRPLKFLSFISEYLEFYIKPKDPKFYDSYGKYMAESWKFGAVDLPAKFTSINKQSEVYAYRFDWDELETHLGIKLSDLLGAAHAMEVPFIFKTAGLMGEGGDIISEIIYDENNRDTDLKLANEIGEYWVNFAYDGNPNNYPYEKKVIWERWDTKNDKEQFIVFDTVNDKGITMFSSTLSADSILQGIASESLKVEQKCYIIDKMFNRTTLTSNEVEEIYDTFMDGKCKV